MYQAGEAVNRLELDLTTIGRGPTERTTRPSALTNPSERAKMVSQSKQQFVAKAIWPATAKTFLITAQDEEAALIKAQRSKEARGCLTVLILKKVDST